MSEELPYLTEEAPNRWLYDFALRKVGTTLPEILQDPRWRRVMNRWVWSDDLDFYQTPIFFKHILKGDRVYQIVYSGQDILGDGVYQLLSVRLHVTGSNVFVDPDDYEMVKGSFECKDFLKYLVRAQFITKDDARILRNDEYREHFRQSTKKMRTIRIPLRKGGKQ